MANAYRPSGKNVAVLFAGFNKEIVREKDFASGHIFVRAVVYPDRNFKLGEYSNEINMPMMLTERY